MTALFEACFAAVIASEGGYTAARVDPGNWTGGRCGSGECRGTKFGISAASYPNIDISALTLQGAMAVYARDFWTPIHGDDLPTPLALLVFDAAVNNGVHQAVVWLQKIAGTHPDGVIGPQTLAGLKDAVEHQGGAAICAEYLALRMLMMSRLPQWTIYGAGWSRRLCRLPYQSLAIADHAPCP